MSVNSSSLSLLSTSRFIQSELVEWEQKDHHLITKLSARVVVVIVKTPLLLLDITVNIFAGLARIFIGVTLVKTINFVCKHLGKETIGHNWTVKQGFFHFGCAGLYLLDIFIQPINNLARRPDAYVNKTISKYSYVFVDPNLADKQGLTPIFYAIDHEQHSRVKGLINAGVDLKRFNEKRQTPLHMIIENDNINMLKTVLTQKVDVNIVDHTGDTPLQLAISTGNLTAFNELMEQDLDVNFPNELGQTALHFAVYEGNVEFVKKLIDKGGHINYQAKNGCTPLHFLKNSQYLDASQKEKYFNVAKLLVDRGADLNLQDDEGGAILHYAIVDHDLERFNLFTEKGANVDIQDNVGCTPLQIAITENNLDAFNALIEKRVNVNLPNYSGITALHFAAFSGNIETVEKLLNKGADINSECQKKCSVFHYLKVSDKQEDRKQKYLELMALLLEHGANINHQDENGCTPLHARIFKKDSQAIEALLEKNADISIEDGGGITPLSYAIIRNKKEAVELLLERGAVVNVQDKKGKTPLYWASSLGNVEIVELLLKADAEPNIGDLNGNTPLHLAAASNHFQVNQLLIQSNANVNIQNNETISPFHYAVIEGNAESLQPFIDANAELNLQDNMGRTPLFLAVQNNNNPAIKFLLEKGADCNLKTQEGYTPVYSAYRRDNFEGISLLLKNGADANYQNDDQNVTGSLRFQIKYQKYKLKDENVKNTPPLKIKLKDNEKQYKLYKLIGHLCSIKENFHLNNNEFKFEGILNQNRLIPNQIKKKLQAFSYIYLNTFKASVVGAAIQALKLISTEFRASDEQLVNQYKENHPIIIETGHQGHYSSVVIWGKHLIWCDRARFAHQQAIYEIGEEVDIATLIQEIRLLKDSDTNNEDDYENYIHNLPNNGIRHKPYSPLSRFMLDNQTSGNCGYANIEDAVYAILMLGSLRQELRDKNINNIDILDDHTIKETLISTIANFHKFRSYQTTRYLKKIRKKNMILSEFAEKRIEQSLEKDFRLGVL